MPDPQGSWYRDVNIRREERELVLVYIGAPSCGPCNDPEFKATLAQFKVALAELARVERRKLRTIGVSNDWEVDSGLLFLRDSGPWDELVVGNNWYNSAVIEHVWNVPAAESAIPQVLVFERSFQFEGNRILPGTRHYFAPIGG